MEDLVELTDDPTREAGPIKRYVQGPYPVFGSNDVNVVFKYGPKHVYRTRSIQTPNSLVTTLVADFDQKVEFTTFLATGNILLKTANRYMIFDPTGEFIDEVEFSDIRKEQMDQFKLEFDKQLAE